MTGVGDTGEEEGMKTLPTDSTMCQEPTERDLVRRGVVFGFSFLAEVVSE